MAPAGGESGTRDESAALSTLESLLRKERTENAAAEVDAVLRSSDPSDEKVRRIIEIDRRSPRPRRERQRGRRYIGTPEIAGGEIRPHAKRPPRVVREHERRSFFGYLFRERRPLREFGERTRTLTTAFFPPQVRLMPDVAGMLVGYLRPTARDVGSMIRQLVVTAWKHLEKTDYNLLVLVLDLCDAIDRLPASTNELGTAETLKALDGVEQRLLAIRYERDAVDRILESIDRLTSDNRGAVENINALPRLTRSLIDRTDYRPSLIDTVLAVAMARCRRFLTEEDLVVPGLGRIIETDVFDCTDTIYDQIREYLTVITHQLEALDRERREILRIRAFVRRDQSEDVDSRQLRQLIQVSSRKSWEQVADNIVAIATAACGPTYDLLQSFFHRPLTLSGVGTTNLFAGLPFDSELQTLSRAADQIVRISDNFPWLSRERFVMLADRRETATSIEADFVMQISIYQDALKPIRDRLRSVLSIDFTSANHDSVTQYLPLAGRETLPFEAEVNGCHKLVNGSSVRSALSTIVELLYVLAYVFGDRALRHTLSREWQVERDIDHLLDTVERIAEPAQGEAIIGRFSR